MGYLLDTNVFLEAKNTHYGFDFCPGFWTWLQEAHLKGVVFSIEKVRDELVDDDAANWADGCPDTFFQKPDTKVLNSLAAVSQWVTSQSFSPSAISIFCSPRTTTSFLRPWPTATR